MYGNIHSPVQRSSYKSLISQAALGLWAISFLSLDVVLAQSAKPPAKPNAPATNAEQNTGKPLLKLGSQGAAVTELQAMLKLMNFYSGTVHGNYDEPTIAAVVKFQKAANLTADGVVGADTWNRLLPPSPVISAATQSSPQSTKPTTVDSFPVPGENKPNAAAPKPNPSTPPKSPAPATKTSAAGSDRAQSSKDTATFPILRLGMQGPAVEGLQERLRALGYLKGSADGVFGAETQAAVRSAQRRLNLEPDGVVGSATWLGLLR
ncbi:MAG: peptidoglycan-binding protein [Leptolyngbyaceae cyanobacterium bins.302]|nr:peptidoglycan-binding protein [Leptolyngbyaceae cyanobacterium bins.302]